MPVRALGTTLLGGLLLLSACSAEPGRSGEPEKFGTQVSELRQPTPDQAATSPAPAATPDPFDLRGGPVTPRALGPAEDVVLPVAWRVQVQFPTRLQKRSAATGIPTEIEVPPPGIGGGDAVEAMVVEMFPAGARFIDEIGGQVFRVANRRVTGANGDQAFLTLDREGVVEDLDVSLAVEGDGFSNYRCPSCTDGVADAAELLRTVWVFPPPVEPGRANSAPLTFAGGQPVVDIDVRTLTVTPAE